MNPMLLTIIPRTLPFQRPWRCAAVLGAGLMTSCAPPAPDPRQLVFTDSFERPNPPGEPAGLFTREQAYSWQQSLKVGQEAEYGGLYRNTWESLRRPHHLRLRLWAWLPAVQLNRATVQVMTRRASPIPGAPPTQLSSQSFTLSEVIRRTRQWVPTTFFVSLPRGLQPTDEVIMFLWVPPGPLGPMYVDDFSIENLD